jgi:cyclase
MTLAKRIIPTMLVRGRTLVKGKQFAGDRSIGHVLQAAKVHAQRGVDELTVLDVAATAEGRGPDLEMVRELSDGCFIPITVGGGVKSLQDIDALLRAGADKICLGSALFTHPWLLSKAAERFGSQAIVVSVDVLAGRSRWLFGASPVQASIAVTASGAGEILLQSIDRDGMMCGYDLDLIRAVSSAVHIPVIASGGCSSYKDMHEAFIAGADACAVGALFAFCDQTPRGAARWLKSRGVEVRL